MSHHHMPSSAASLQLLKQTEAFSARTYYQLNLPGKLVLTDGEKALKPNYYLHNQLFQQLRQSVIRHTKEGRGMTYVYFSPRRTGKTTAGLALLEYVIEVSSAFFEIPVPCKFIDAGTSLRHSMRKAMGVPDGVDDIDFINRLCNVVLKSNPGLPHVAKEYSNSLLQPPPVLVIDNVRSFSIADQDFLETLYKACYQGRILLFILTDDEEIANMICGMNGKARIKPLEGMFAIEKESDDWKIEELKGAITGKVATGIDWKVQTWNRKELSKIVVERYEDFGWSEQQDSQGLLVFVEDDMLPDTAFQLAERVMANTAPDEILSLMSLLDDSKYDNVTQEDDNLIQHNHNPDS